VQRPDIVSQILHEWACEGLLSSSGLEQLAHATRARSDFAHTRSQESVAHARGRTGMTKPAPPTLDSFNLAAAERHLCEQALLQAGSIVHAAELLGVTRHSLKRRIVKLGIEWPRATGLSEGAES
jgi:transcriptional regulator with GAF, ATPase, and Fis domain